MSSRFSFLANVTGGDIFLNISRHSRPIVGGCYAIIGFGVTSKGGFSKDIMYLAHDFNMKRIGDAKL